MEIDINNKTRFKLNKKEIESLILFLTGYFCLKDKELSLAFVGDKVMTRINYEYRGYNKPTDILSFEGEGNFLGELLIDCAQIKRQAPFYSTSFSKELLFIIIHGFLHLMGYNDEVEEDRQKMVNKGRELLDLFYNNKKI